MRLLPGQGRAAPRKARAGFSRGRRWGRVAAAPRVDEVVEPVLARPRAAAARGARAGHEHVQFRCQDNDQRPSFSVRQRGQNPDPDARAHVLNRPAGNPRPGAPARPSAAYRSRTALSSRPTAVPVCRSRERSASSPIPRMRP